LLLIKSLKTTPGTRHQVKLKTIHFLKKQKKYYNFSKKQFNNKYNRLKRRMYFFKSQHLINVKQQVNKIPSFIVNYFTKTDRLKEFVLVKNIFGFAFFNSITNFSYPGLKYYSLEYLLTTGLTHKLINQFIPLQLIPLNLTVSNVYNYSNSKNTYAKSVGSSAIRQKNIKKSKLIVLELPSKILKYLPVYTVACFGFFKPINTKKIVEGK